MRRLSERGKLMSDELRKLRESIKRSTTIIKGIKAIPIPINEPEVLAEQTETGERSQTEEPPRSE